MTRITITRFKRQPHGWVWKMGQETHYGLWQPLQWGNYEPQKHTLSLRLKSKDTT